ncbi:MAG: biotin/lipoyl-containing protein, partial [Thermomicrobiales bacterium]
TAYKEPGGVGIRIDGATEAGAAISPRYDSMIAKLIARGSDRAEAIARMERALGEFTIGGVASTIPFHRTVLAHPIFAGGKATTDWIEQDGIGRDLPPAEIEPAEDQPATTSRDYTLEVNGKRFSVRLVGVPEAEAAPAAATAPAGRAATRPLPKRGGAAANGNGALNSPIQGTVLRVAVESGATVKAGDLVCVIEAMKMENEITAPRDGTVQELAIKPGQAVRIGERLAVIAES